MGVTEVEKEKLFRQVRHSLGSTIRQVELTDELLCTYLEIAIEDYAQYVQDWLIENQWSSLLGKDADKIDISFALSTRDINFQSQFTYAYSKQVGLQARGPWELKKDFIQLEEGKQTYVIPAGRELNQVLWYTPSSTDAALFSNMAGGFDTGFGGGFSQAGTGIGGGTAGSGIGGTAGYYIAPAFDVLLTAQDMNLKNRFLRSELVYKLTAGPNGTRLLHLESTPGSKLSFGGGFTSGAGTGGGLGLTSIGIRGSKVWYYYYDVNPGNAEQCREDNPDIIKIPSDVNLSNLDFSEFNAPTKILIRQLLVADSKKALGIIRGKYSGELNVPQASVTMDYSFLLEQGIREREIAMERLKERLETLSNTRQLEIKANDAENLNRHLKHIPMGLYVI